MKKSKIKKEKKKNCRDETLRHVYNLCTFRPS